MRAKKQEDIDLLEIFNKASGFHQHALGGVLQFLSTFFQMLIQNNVSIPGQSRQRHSDHSQDTSEPQDHEFLEHVYEGAPNFEDAVKVVLESEGVLSNHKKDKGGLTKYGISEKANPDIDVANLTKVEAITIYRERYWNTIDGIETMSQAQSLFLFDTAVNHGCVYANRLYQKTGGDLEEMFTARRDKYHTIVANNPSQKVFLNGWLNRLDRLKDHIEAIGKNNTYAKADTSPEAPAPAFV